jgi:hypothetical protein
MHWRFQAVNDPVKPRHKAQLTVSHPRMATSPRYYMKNDGGIWPKWGTEWDAADDDAETSSAASAP